MKKTGQMLRRNSFFRGSVVLGVVVAFIALLVTQLPTPTAFASASADFKMDGNKLVKYAGTANTVSVPASVKIIGAEAFADCTFLTGVTIANGVEVIEYGAFSGCKSLRRITIPASVTQIGREAFSNCEQLNKVILGKGVETIEPGAFLSCTSLKTIDVLKDNAYFVSEKGALYNKTKTKLYAMCAGNTATRLTMPSTVESVEPYAFWNCTNLREISFSGNLKEISAYAFSNCNGLEKVSIPYSVGTIDMKAFENCKNLKLVEIPPSVSYIHPTAFDGCKLLHISAQEGSVAKTFQETWEANQETIAETTSGNETTKTPTTETTTETKEPAANQETNTNSGNATEKKDDTAGTTSGKELGETVIVSNRAVILMDGKQTVYSGSAAHTDTTQKESQGAAQTIPQKIAGSDGKVTADLNTKIPEAKFYRNEQLTDYTISNTVQRIGNFAFARSALREIAIPEGVTTIGYAAFYHCDSLEKVSIPKSVTDIKAQAFQKTKWMNQWMEEGTDEFLIEGDGILLAYRGNQAEIVIPDGVKKIAGEAFLNHSEIMTVQMPATLTDIGDNAFANCTSLTTVTGGENLTNISASAFLECPLQNVQRASTKTK